MTQKRENKLMEIISTKELALWNKTINTDNLKEAHLDSLIPYIKRPLLNKCQQEERNNRLPKCPFQIDIQIFNKSHKNS